MLQRLFVLCALGAGCSARPAATVQQVPSPTGLRFEIEAVDRAADPCGDFYEFRIDDGTPVNGRLTLGENLADNGGLRLAWDALRPSTTGPMIDGFTPAQRFFLAWGQIRCENTTPRAARVQVQGDGHSPGRFRVNGVVRNMPEFAEAFSCPTGSAMAPSARCRLW
jgi:putative endopeptidase